MRNRRQQEGFTRVQIMRERACFALMGLVLLFFFRPMFGGETFFFRDLYLHAFADKLFFVEQFKQGVIPFWNPYILGGEPYFSNIVISGFYPLNVIFFLFPLIHAFNIFIVLHFLLAAGGAYFFARTLSLSPISSFLVGAIYTLCGGMLSTANLPGLIFDMPYLPLIWACWHLFLLRRTRRWFLLSVALGVFQALAWTHECNEITMLSLLGWTLCYPYPQQTSLIRKMLLWGLVTALIVACCAVVLLPAVEIVGNSGRQYQLNEDEFARFSLHPKRLPELVFPNFFGSMNAIRPRDAYWGWNLVGHYPPMMLNLYFGGMALALACLGAWLPARANDHFPHRVRWHCAILAFCCLLGALGNFLPFFSLIYTAIPFLDFLFHSPEKLIIGTFFPVALLAGYASDWFGQARSERLEIFRRLTWSAYGFAAVLFAVFGLFSWLPQMQSWWVVAFFKRPVDDMIARQGLAASLLHAAAMLLLLAMLLTYRRLAPNRWQPLLLAGIVLCDLWIANSPINFYAPRDFFTDLPDAVKLVKQEIGDGRLFAADVPSNSTLNAPSDEMFWLSRWSLETLSGYSGYTYGIPVIFHDDANNLGQKYVVLLHQYIKSLRWEQKLPIFSAGAVSLIITHEALSLPGLERIAEIPNHSSLQFFLYRNTRAASRATFVTQAQRVDSDDAALAILTNPEFDPRTHVVLSDSDAPEERLASGLQSPTPADIRIERQTPNAMTATVSTDHAGYLVLSEPFYPGWEATVDGTPAPQFRANLAFTAIPLPAGKHVVRREYKPRLFYAGAWMSLGFVILTIVLTHKRFGIVKG